MDTVLTPLSVAGAPLGVRVYVALRKDLMNGEFSPFMRLGEERLAARYEVSRTPVREALKRLIADGLVDRRDGGLYVHVPSFKELTHLYELRVTLEQQGIVRAMSDPTVSHDGQRLESELLTWQEMRSDRPAPDASFVIHDESFHRTLLDSAGNPAITAALDQVNARIRAVRMYDYLTDDRLDATFAEHISILELVLGNKLSLALDLLREHIGVSKDVVTERAARALALAQLNSNVQEYTR